MPRQVFRCEVLLGGHLQWLNTSRNASTYMFMWRRERERHSQKELYIVETACCVCFVSVLVGVVLRNLFVFCLALNHNFRPLQFTMMDTSAKCYARKKKWQELAWTQKMVSFRKLKCWSPPAMVYHNHNPPQKGDKHHTNALKIKSYLRCPFLEGWCDRWIQWHGNATWLQEVPGGSFWEWGGSMDFDGFVYMDFLWVNHLPSSWNIPVWHL